MIAQEKIDQIGELYQQTVKTAEAAGEDSDYCFIPWLLVTREATDQDGVSPEGSLSDLDPSESEIRLNS